MSKKIITIIIAAAMIASSAINAFAVGNTSNNSFNVSAQTYTTDVYKRQLYKLS